MRGNPDSCGVWAPCLTHTATACFIWSIPTSNATSGDAKDAHNYITTCATIDGDWSAPVYVNSSGFDPVLVSRRRRPQMVRSTCSGTTVRTSHRSAASCCRRSTPETLRPFGPVRNIFHGSAMGMEEGAASVQARWLLLPAHRRRRHRVRPRLHAGALRHH